VGNPLTGSGHDATLNDGQKPERSVATGDEKNYKSWKPQTL